MNRTLNVLGSGLQHKAGSRWWLKRCWFSKVQEPIENNSCKDCRKLCWWKNRSTSVVTNFSFWIVFVDSCLQFHITLSHIRGTVTDHLVISWKSPESQWPCGYHIIFWSYVKSPSKCWFKFIGKKHPPFASLSRGQGFLPRFVGVTPASLHHGFQATASLCGWHRQGSTSASASNSRFFGEAWEAHICTGNRY